MEKGEAEDEGGVKICWKVAAEKRRSSKSATGMVDSVSGSSMPVKMPALTGFRANWPTCDSHTSFTATTEICWLVRSLIDQEIPEALLAHVLA